jgi:hypothetical protein
MDKYYVSLGMQCTVPTLFQNTGVKKETLPFDWMLSSPKFVFEMLDLLLNKEISTDELVRNYFFKCNKKSNLSDYEHYVENEGGNALYNEKYNVIFPHDGNDEENILKYIKRFDRLKDLILNKDNQLILVYVSQSSAGGGNFTINGKEVIFDVYKYIDKIYKLISKKRNNFNIILFDTINLKDNIKLNKKINLIKIEPKNTFMDMLPEVEDEFKKYISKL